MGPAEFSTHIKPELIGFSAGDRVMPQIRCHTEIGRYVLALKDLSSSFQIWAQKNDIALPSEFPADWCSSRDFDQMAPYMVLLGFTDKRTEYWADEFLRAYAGPGGIEVPKTGEKYDNKQGFIGVVYFDIEDKEVVQPPPSKGFLRSPITEWSRSSRSFIDSCMKALPLYREPKLSQLCDQRRARLGTTEWRNVCHLWPEDEMKRIFNTRPRELQEILKRGAKKRTHQSKLQSFFKTKPPKKKRKISKELAAKSKEKMAEIEILLNEGVITPAQLIKLAKKFQS